MRKKGCSFPCTNGRNRSRRWRTVVQRKRRRAELLEKLRELEGIVPGGAQLGLEGLLRRTADYIAMLELKVVLLRCCSLLCSTSSPN